MEREPTDNDPEPTIPSRRLTPEGHRNRPKNFSSHWLFRSALEPDQVREIQTLLREDQDFIKGGDMSRDTARKVRDLLLPSSYHDTIRRGLAWMVRAAEASYKEGLGHPRKPGH